MSEVTEMMLKYQAHAKALAEANTTNKTSICSALAAASITLVTVNFDGGGDSGQIQEIVAQIGDTAAELPNVQVEILSAPWDGRKAEPAMVSLRHAIEGLCFDYLSQEHGGWENNDGGQGDFTFHVDEQRIELDFNQFYTESTNHSHTF